jgi:bifunctional DNA-binding transcriptional regulator/antitoxin component of YhaV-PrlF toxin-antitoxin module
MECGKRINMELRNSERGEIVVPEEIRRFLGFFPTIPEFLSSIFK